MKQNYFFILILSCLFKLNASKIVFIVPKNGMQEQQLNSQVESLFQRATLKPGWLVEANVKQTFYVYFKNEIANNTVNSTSKQSHVYYLYFTVDSKNCDDYANYTHTPIVLNRKKEKRKSLFKFEIDVTLKHELDKVYYICLSKSNENFNEYSDRNATTDLSFDHQGNTSYLTISTFESVFPIWIKLVIYSILVILNSTFNGLNLGLMSLSVEELKLLIKTSDSAKERKYADNILPLRKKGNYLLCSILLSITMTSATSVLILDDLIQGFLAGIVSTLILCIIGEIIPQALFSKYPLEIGSYTRKLTYFFICLTSLLSYPLGKVVDYLLGTELPREYSRDSIKELIKKSIGLHEKQCRIINGALDLRKKYVSDIMIRLDQVFMLQENERLNFETIVRIYNSGFSRIPVYNKAPNDITGLIHIKDLIITDPNDEIKVKKLVKLFKHNVTYCYTSDNLLKMFEIFRRGVTHMAFVLEIVQNSNTDPYYECVGIVTLHDIIETLVQFEIYEGLKMKENSKGVEYLKKLIESHQFKSSISFKSKSQEYLNEKIDSNSSELTRNGFLSLTNAISFQTKLVIMQVLTTLRPFKSEFIEMNVLEKLLNSSENFVYKYMRPNDSNQNMYIYEYQKACDYFVMLIEGSFIVESGVEKIESFAKQLEHFGTKALLDENETFEQVLINNNDHKSYVPEFALRIDSSNQLNMNKNNFISVIYFKLNRKSWLDAVKVTQLNKRKYLE